MRWKTIYACFDSELTFLQNQEIEIGRRSGLSEKNIQKYACREYNFLQMEQIRLAFQQGLDWKYVKYICNPTLRIEQMKLYRKNPLLALIDRKKKWIVRICIGCICFCISIYCFYRYEEPYLKLKHETVNMKVGDTFSPMEYIDSYSNQYGELILPQPIDTSKSGNYVLLYTLLVGNTQIEKVLYVNVN